jgi:hypothetical protein
LADDSELIAGVVRRLFKDLSSHFTKADENIRKVTQDITVLACVPIFV